MFSCKLIFVPAFTRIFVWTNLLNSERLFLFMICLVLVSYYWLTNLSLSFFFVWFCFHPRQSLSIEKQVEDKKKKLQGRKSYHLKDDIATEMEEVRDFPMCSHFDKLIHIWLCASNPIVILYTSLRLFELPHTMSEREREKKRERERERERKRERERERERMIVIVIHETALAPIGYLSFCMLRLSYPTIIIHPKRRCRFLLIL